jgi:hypothetical protein
MPSTRSKRLGRPTKYPWDLWLSGVGAFRLERGKEYTCSTESFIASFAKRARQQGLVPHWEYPRNTTLLTADEVTIWVEPSNKEPEYPPGLEFLGKYANWESEARILSKRLMRWSVDPELADDEEKIDLLRDAAMMILDLESHLNKFLFED